MQLCDILDVGLLEPAWRPVVVFRYGVQAAACVSDVGHCQLADDTCDDWVLGSPLAAEVTAYQISSAVRNTLNNSRVPGGGAFAGMLDAREFVCVYRPRYEAFAIWAGCLG